MKETDEQLDNDLINAKLKEDVLKRLGTLYVKLADQIVGIDDNNIKILKNGHKKTITCCVVSSDNQFIYSASKDSSIIKWDAISGKKLKIIKGGRLGTNFIFIIFFFSLYN